MPVKLVGFISVQISETFADMRFVIVSDSLTSSTGFGKQTRLLAFNLFNRGHEVFVIARQDKKCGCQEWDNCDTAKGPVEVLTEQFMDVACVEELIRIRRPDVILFLRNAKYLHQFNSSKLFAEAKTLLWYADENEAPTLSNASRAPHFPDNSLLPVSRAVASSLGQDKVAGVLYHGLDFSKIPVRREKTELRKLWSGRLGIELSSEEILLICAERNDVRKNWDATYALVRRVKDLMQHSRVRLLQLTSQTEKEPYFDLRLCGEFYQLGGSIIDLNGANRFFSDSDIYELLMLSDLRISCSGAEGFGLLSLEAAALLVPQVCVKLRAFAEYLGEDNKCLVEPFRLAVYPQDSFYYASKVYAIPEINRMADRVVELLTNSTLRNEVVEESYKKVRSTCNLPDVVDKLLEIIHGMPSPRMFA
ncbi:MAG: hypothetical protein K1X79_13450 [Oligoflexia bacterium]|nr:hypothetical protein [Oligoflexia bacterium]